MLVIGCGGPSNSVEVVRPGKYFRRMKAGRGCCQEVSLRTKQNMYDFVRKQFYKTVKESSKLTGQAGGYTYS